MIPLSPPLSSKVRTKRGTARKAPPQSPPPNPAPPFENGDHLSALEFMRRYESIPDTRKAQLIEGVVFMPSPVRTDVHAIPDGLIQLWLGCYALQHEGLAVCPNASLILDAENALQPDAILCSTPREGGRTWLNDSGYLCGSPELVCEITASSASVDLHEKFRAYRRAGIAEYLVWMTTENRVRWFQSVDGDYVEAKERAGKLRSAVFPGLVLDVRALLKLDRRKVIAALGKAGI